MSICLEHSELQAIISMMKMMRKKDLVCISSFKPALTDSGTYRPPLYDPRAHAFSLYQRHEALDEEREHELVGRMVRAEKFQNL